MTDDLHLLRTYANNGSEDDFARKIGEAEKELAEGRYANFQELTRALQRKVLSVQKP